MVFLKEFFKKVEKADLKNRRQKNHEKLPSMQRVKVELAKYNDIQ